MKPKTRKHLDDIHDAAAFIREATSSRTLQEYRTDRILRQAIERNFEIIGEAIGRLAKSDPAVAAHIEHTSEIIAFRNVLIHGYDLVDDGRVWETIVNDVLPLEERVAALLAEPDGTNAGE